MGVVYLFIDMGRLISRSAHERSSSAATSEVSFCFWLFIVQAYVFSVTFCQMQVKTLQQDVLTTDGREEFLLEGQVVLKSALK